MKELSIIAALLALPFLTTDAEAGKRRACAAAVCEPCECPTTTTTIPPCVKGDPEPPSPCLAADGTPITNADRDYHCATYCVAECACVPSDTYGFPNCRSGACE
jgi:hypothetical protein